VAAMNMNMQCGLKN